MQGKSRLLSRRAFAWSKFEENPREIKTCRSYSFSMSESFSPRVSCQIGVSTMANFSEGHRPEMCLSVIHLKDQSARLDTQAFDPSENRRSVALARGLAQQIFAFQPAQPGFRQAYPEDSDILQNRIGRAVISQRQPKAAARAEH